MRRRSVRNALMAVMALVGGLAAVVSLGGTASAAVVSQTLDCGAAGAQTIKFDASAPATVIAGGTYTVDIAGQPGKVDGAALSNITYSFQAPTGTNVVAGSSSVVAGTGSISSGSFGSVTTVISGSVVQLKIPGPVPSGATATPPTLRFQLQATAAAGTVLATKVRQNPAYQFTASSSAGSIALSCSTTGSTNALTSTSVVATTTTTGATTSTSAGATTTSTLPTTTTTAPPVVTTQTWSPTGCGASQSTVAPPGTTSIAISATGGNGGRSGSQGGSSTVPGGTGSNAVATFSASAGLPISAIVGCNGVDGGSFANTGTPGGWSAGGGAGRGHVIAGVNGGSAGSGGGASAVCSGTSCKADVSGVAPLVVAGGAGGGGVSNCSGTSSGPGGAGGTGASTAAGSGSGPSGADGTSANGGGGTGGSNSSGGSGNGGSSPDGSGGAGLNVTGGGGGGGYVGGAAGGNASTGCKGAGGGGGGSSWILGTATGPAFGTGGSPGVVVTFSISTPATTTTTSSTTTSTTTPQTCTPDIVPFATSEALVRRQHVDFVGRQPTTSELADWVGPIAACTKDADALVQSLIPAPQTTTDARLVRIYHAYFGRAPDPSGFDYWTRQLDLKGRGMIVVAQKFAESSEFKTTYGSLTNAAFVELVYQNVLDRASEPTGKAFWVNRLDKGTANRGTVMQSFSDSSENVTLKRGLVDVWRALRTMRVAFPSAGEFATLTDPILAGTSTVQDAISTIRHSTGYAARF